MVNHTATLLANIESAQRKAEEDSAVFLITDLGLVLSNSMNQSIGSQPATGAPAFSDGYGAIINRKFKPLTLPSELQKVYTLLFPVTASSHHNQLRLFYYLSLIESSDRREDIHKLDTRITYNLNELQEYFRFSKISSTKSNNPVFNLVVNGTYETTEKQKDFFNAFVVKQIQDTQNLLILSATQGEYLAPGKAPSQNPEGMSIPLVFASGNASASINIADTSLNCYISGPLAQFTQTSNKMWTFSAEAPFSLSFDAFYKELLSNEAAIEAMLELYSDRCDISYSHIWKMHYNAVYRVAALLLAYVERVNVVWENTRT